MKETGWDRRRLSPSAAETWEQCPAKWKARYVDGVEESPGPEAMIGQMTHQVLERLARDGRFDARSAAVVAERLWVGQPVEWRVRALGLVFAALPGLVGARVVGVERRVEVELAGVPFVGVVDRVDETAAGTVMVVDYKTGRRPDVGGWLEPKRRQVRLYAAAVEAADARPVAGGRLVWLAAGVVDEVDVSRDAVEEAVGWLRATWEAISEAVECGVFEPRPGPLCSWCPAVAGCEAGLVAVRRRAAAGRSLGVFGRVALGL